VWTTLLGRAGDGVQAALALVIPVLVCALLQYALQGPLFGLLGVLFAIAVLWFAWGPRDLGRDIEAVVKAPDSERRLAAVQALRPDSAQDALPWQAAPLVEATFRSALQRWFGVLFWFLLLGPTGALAYRLAQVLAYGDVLVGERSANGRALAQRVALVLDWAPAHLMALSMAVAADFESVFHAWHAHHQAGGRSWFSLDLGFLAAIARAGVDADVVAGDGYAEDVDDPMVELIDARRLLVRVLVVWLAVAGVFALGGWFN
jgi:AmpE protein